MNIEAHSEARHEGTRVCASGSPLAMSIQFLSAAARSEEGGKLVGVQVGAVTQRAIKSHDYLFSKTGWHFDPFC